jgi:hypothetical protein
MSHTGSVQTEAAPELVRRYRQDGFVVVEGLLDPAELEEWRREVDEAVARTRPGVRRTPGGGSVVAAGTRPKPPGRTPSLRGRGS